MGKANKQHRGENILNEVCLLRELTDELAFQLAMCVLSLGKVAEVPCNLFLPIDCLSVEHHSQTCSQLFAPTRRSWFPLTSNKPGKDGEERPPHFRTCFTNTFVPSKIDSSLWGWSGLTPRVFDNKVPFEGRTCGAWAAHISVGHLFY